MNSRLPSPPLKPEREERVMRVMEGEIEATRENLGGAEDIINTPLGAK